MLTEDLTLRNDHRKVWKKSNGQVAYIEVGAELHCRDGQEWRPCDFALRTADPGDLSDYKISKCLEKVGYSKTGWKLGRKIQGKQFRSRLATFGILDPKTLQITPIMDAEHELLDSAGKAANIYPFVDLHYLKSAGTFHRQIRFNNGFAIPHIEEYPEGAEFCWLEEIEMDGVEITSGKRTWDKETDFECEVADVWKDGIHLFTFIREFIYGWDNPSEAVEEKKCFVKRNGKYYLIESIPLSTVKMWNYAKGPLIANYTTVSGAIAADETWSGTVYISSAVGPNDGVTITISEGTKIKVNSGITAMQITTTGNIVVNGTAANPVIVTSYKDDSVGETIAGSDGIPKVGDFNQAFLINTAATKSIIATDMIVRHAGLYACNMISANSSFNFSRVMFENIGGYCVAATGGGTTRTITATDLTIRNSLRYGTSGATYGVYADEVYITRYNFYGNHGGAVQLTVGTAATSSYIRNAKIVVGSSSTAAIAAVGTIKITNATITGRSASSATVDGIRYTGSSGTCTVQYCIVSGFASGLNRTSTGTFTHDYNVIYDNATNFNGSGMFASDHEYQYAPNWEYLNTLQGLECCGYNLHTTSIANSITTPDKVNDAGFEYALGRTVLASEVRLVAGENIPFGYLQNVQDEPLAVEIDLWLKKDGQKTVQYNLEDQIVSDGCIKTASAANNVEVLVEVRRLSDDVLQQTLFSGTYNFPANTYVPLANIAGQELAFVPDTTGAFYVAIAVSAGSPMVFASDNSCCFQVVSLEEVAPSAPFIVSACDKGVGGIIEGKILTPDDSDYQRTEIYYNGADGRLTELGGELTGEQTAFSISNLINGRNYFLQAFSYDTSGNISRGSNIVMAIPTEHGSSAMQILYETLLADLSAVEGLTAVRQGEAPPSSREAMCACLTPEDRDAERADSASEIASYTFELTLFTREKNFARRIEAAALILDRVRRTLQSKQYAGVAGHFDTVVKNASVKSGNNWPNYTSLQTGLKITCFVNETI